MTTSDRASRKLRQVKFLAQHPCTGTDSGPSASGYGAVRVGSLEVHSHPRLEAASCRALNVLNSACPDVGLLGLMTGHGVFAVSIRTAQSAVGHVDEPRVVTLEGDRDVTGRAVAVFGHDQVRLAGAGGLLLVGVLAVQQDHHVGVLLDRS